MFLRYVTITGVDQRTDLSRLKSLSAQYPFVEWGILYSPSRSGSENRYMSIEQLVDLPLYYYARPNLSLHLCGKGVNQFIDAELPFRVENFSRVQLNFNAQRDRGWYFEELVEACLEYPHTQFITQDNANNHDVFGHLFRLPNHAMLWDASGGAGKTANSIPVDTTRGVFYGFAGGINPDNVRDRLCSLEEQFGRNIVTWIDMESGVRTDDWLDLDKVETVLENVAHSGVILL